MAESGAVLLSLASSPWSLCRSWRWRRRGRGLVVERRHAAAARRSRRAYDRFCNAPAHSRKTRADT
jgi:hypothetical protein